MRKCGVEMDGVSGECRSCMKGTLSQSGTMLHVSRLIDCYYVGPKTSVHRLSWVWLDVDVILLLVLTSVIAYWISLMK